MADRQTLADLRAEIAFREKLARQHVTGEVLLPDYYGKEEHDRILLERIEATRERMTALAASGVRLSPFLELGAERGQRSLVLVNEFGASGIAADISYHQLRAMDHFAERFGLPRLPMRVCCDANALPFRDGAFPFVFCYQFLHHFPAIAPVMAEVRRVMSNGHFFFDEEPYRRVLQANLYQQSTKVSSRERGRRNRHVNLVESFLSTERCDEEEHGVIENDRIPLSDWASALSAFDAHETDLRSIYGVRSRLAERPRLGNALNWLLGGIVSGLARSASGPAGDPPDEIDALLACPACMRMPEQRAGRPPLIRERDEYRCTQCGARYPSRDGVIVLIPPAERAELYPDL